MTAMGFRAARSRTDSPRTDRKAENRLAWSAALDRLEQEVALAEQVLAAHQDPGSAEPWTPPRMLGPIPMDLVPRAQEIQERQVALQRDLSAAMLANQRHQQVADKALQLEAARPAYLDTTA